jgi:hypothetical protein
MPTTTKNGPPGATAEERRFIERNHDRLSKSTLRAKWTHEPGEEPDRNGQTLATRSPDVIRDWAQRRGGEPATATRGPDGEPRTLRLAFRDGEQANGGGRRSRLEPIDWEDWLRVFQDRDLVFLYQERRRDGSDSTFFRLDNPRREDG